MNKYTDYEKEILESFENDEWQSTSDLESEKKKYSRIARDTILKNKRINIRISERDLSKLKSKSVEEGIPYQTLISSILHKYISGKLVEEN
jgi:predicted DNA binding CopG/RHH family protein